MKVGSISLTANEMGMLSHGSDKFGWIMLEYFYPFCIENAHWCIVIIIKNTTIRNVHYYRQLTIPSRRVTIHP